MSNETARTNWSSDDLNHLADDVSTLRNSGSQTFRGTKFYALGDSQIVQSPSVAGTSDGAGVGALLGWSASDKSVLGWAALLSDGRITIDGLAAASGYTTTQVLTTYLPWVVSARPAACLIQMGTNDIGTDSVNGWSTAATNIATAIAALNAVGTIPILCTIGPRTDIAGLNPSISKLNVWIQRQAQLHGYPMIDWYAAILGPNGTGALDPYYDSGDHIHPIAKGYQALGTLVAKQLAGILPNHSLYRAGLNSDSSLTLLNNLLQVDTNVDGVPDNWTATGAGGTYALAAESGIYGNAFSITRGANDLTLTATPSGGAAGERIYVALRIKAVRIPAGGSVTVQITDTVTGGQYVFKPLAAFTRPFDWHTVAIDYAIPATSSGIRLQVLASGASGVKLKIAEPTVINLTSKGVPLT